MYVCDIHGASRHICGECADNERESVEERDARIAELEAALEALAGLVGVYGGSLRDEEPYAEALRVLGD